MVSGECYHNPSWSRGYADYLETRITRINYGTRITRISYGTRITRITYETRITRITYGTQITRITHGDADHHGQRVSEMSL